MEKHYLTIKQMQFLQSLGLRCDNANHYYFMHRTDMGSTISIMDNMYRSGQDVPCLDLDDIVDILESCCTGGKYWKLLMVTASAYSVQIRDMKTQKAIVAHKGSCLIDVAYNVLVQCLKKGYLKI